jgi:hypothetical protein
MTISKNKLIDNLIELDKHLEAQKLQAHKTYRDARKRQNEIREQLREMLDEKTKREYEERARIINAWTEDNVQKGA